MLLRFGITRVYLHPHSEIVKKEGHYFEYPDRSVLLKLKSKEDFSHIELNSIKF